MLKLEAQLPGFGGFYIDSLARVVVYMKPSGHFPDQGIRGVLTAFYAGWPRAREREIMGASSSAIIKQGDFSLSELIAVENKIGGRLLSIPGIAGVGVSLRSNRVKVGFVDSASIPAGVATLVADGVPARSIVAEVWGRAALTSVFTDKIRNTKAGVEVCVGDRIDTYGQHWSECGSHGFTVTSGGAKYFLTAAHLANVFWGQNGKTGDVVYQPLRDAILNNQIGSITFSAPYQQNTDCPVDDASGLYPDYCTDADAALGSFSGVDGDKKVATSTYEGQNGAVGNPNINGYYNIGNVIDPEYVISHPTLGVHKSGFRTGTTTGVIDAPLTKVVMAQMPWGSPIPPSTTVSFILYNVARVTHAGVGGGDSGGPVFAGNGSPYSALGIEVAGGPIVYGSGGVCTAGTSCVFYFTRWSNIEARLGMSLNPITGQ